MNQLETELEIAADGSVRLVSPLPAGWRPGRAHAVLTLEGSSAVAINPTRQIPHAPAELIARRLAAFAELRRLDPYRTIADPVAWQQEIREDVVQQGRE